MLRITEKLTRDPVGVVLLLHGRLVAEWVTVLQETSSEWQRRRVPLAIDLSGIQFVDEAGVELLRRLRRDGIRCLSCAPLIEALLDPRR